MSQRIQSSLGPEKTSQVQAVVVGLGLGIEIQAQPA